MSSGMVINTNVMSLTAQRHLDASKADQQQAMERLSSGQRINSAADDAAGLAIGERFTAQIKGMEQAERNASDGISFAQTAEGAMEEMSNLLQRTRELAVQAANDTNTAADRRALNSELEQAVQEIDRIAQSTQFNGQNVLNGSLDQLSFQVGANRAQSINVNGIDVRGEQLGAEITEGQSVQRSLNAEGNAGSLEVGNVSVNGQEVSMEGVREVADAVDRINEVAASTGVQASRADRAVTQQFEFSNPGSGAQGSISINGERITFQGADDDAQALQNFVDKVNASAQDTGVRATKGEDGTFQLTSNSDFRVAETGSGSTPFANADAIGDNGTRFERGIELASDVGREASLSGEGLGKLGLTDGDGNTLQAQTHTVSGPQAMSVETQEAAQDAIRTADFALGRINEVRADLGAIQNRFEATTNNLQNTSENMEASRSRIMDADFAKETAEMTRAQVLQQAGTSVLSQANQAPQSVLSLLQ